MQQRATHRVETAWRVGAGAVAVGQLALVGIARVSSRGGRRRGPGHASVVLRKDTREKREEEQRLRQHPSSGSRQLQQSTKIIARRRWVDDAGGIVVCERGAREKSEGADGVRRAEESSRTQVGRQIVAAGGACHHKGSVNHPLLARLPTYQVENMDIPLSTYDDLLADVPHPPLHPTRLPNSLAVVVMVVSVVHQVLN